MENLANYLIAFINVAFVVFLLSSTLTDDLGLCLTWAIGIPWGLTMIAWGAIAIVRAESEKELI